MSNGPSSQGTQGWPPKTEPAAGDTAHSNQASPGNPAAEHLAGATHAGPRVTGIGSLPAAVGLATDERRFSAREFQARAVAMAPQLPYLAEAPGRGIGADMLGRTLAMVAAVTTDLAASMTPSGWRRSAPGRDLEAAAAMLHEDIDSFCSAIAGFAGVVKLQVVGPFTLAACLEGVNGERMLGDRAFVSDVPAMLAEAVAAMTSAVRRQSSASEVVIQIDEPMLPMVINGSVSTASGLHRHPSVPAPQAADILQRFVAALNRPAWIHCCADSVPMEVLCGAGARAISVDVRAVADAHLDSIGQHIDAGGDLALGVIHPTQWGFAAQRQAGAAVAAAEKLRVKLGFSEDSWLPRLLLTPSCGLAGATAEQATSAMAALESACTSLAGGTISTEES